MLKSEYDVIVVGAGPAGSIAARTAAGHGLDVLLIEKRQEVGEPVRCGEGVIKENLIEFIALDPKWICAEIMGARIYSPNGKMLELTDKNTVGYILERKLFDRALTMSAANTGVEVQVKTQATSLIIKKGNVSGIKGRHNGNEFEVRAKVVVGADGIESKVGRWAGLNTCLKLKNVGSCVQFLVTDIDLDPCYCEFYTGGDHAPGGYAWVFPKGKHEANVGIGILGNRLNDRPPIKYLEKFVDWRFPGGKIIEVVAGAVPASDLLPRFSSGGIVLAGDAGRLCDPLTGGGILNGMKSGRIAGNVIADVLKIGDVSPSALMRYDREIYRSLGKTIGRNYLIKERLVNLSDENMNKFLKYFGTCISIVPLSMVTKELFGCNDSFIRKMIMPIF